MKLLSKHVVIPLLALFTPLIVQADCTPAANPDLNHDGTVGLQDQTMVAYSFGLPADHPRFNPIADTNCDGSVDITDILFVRNAFGQTFPIPPKLNMSSDFSIPTDMRMGLQDNDGIYSVFKLSARTANNQFDESASFHVKITHSIQPESGLSFLSLPNEILSSEQGSIEHYTTYALKASQEGNYRIATIATVVETGEKHTFETQVQVIDGAETMPSMGLMSINPFALPLDESTDVRFTIRVSGIMPEKIQSIHLHRVGETDKQQMTAVQHTHGYGISMQIDTTGMQADDCLLFQADVLVENKVYPSEEAKVCITGFPINTGYSAIKLISDNINKLLFINDELIVQFNDGVSEATIRSIASNINADVVENAGDGMYRLKLNTVPASLEELKNIAKSISLLPEVEAAFPHPMLFNFSSSIANDPKYESEQFGFFQTTRADEAWYVARRGVEQTIAILDSGISTNHAELQNKIIGGKDYLTLGFGDFDDDDGHGTAVAGIAAATTNNNIGIAGMSWNSNLYVAQVSNSLTTFDFQDIGINFLTNPLSIAPYLAVSNAINDAIDKAKIINISMGVPSHEGLTKNLVGRMCKATAKAIKKDRLIVAAAGNDGDTKKQYPAACSGVIAVGGVSGFLPRKDTPNQDITSQHGGWVDFAADSSVVYTTFPKNGCAICDFNYDSAGYGTFNGTSAAAPQVSGALAILANRHPEMKSPQLLERLKKSGLALPENYEVGKLVDIFEAVFNGGFELVKKGTDEPEEWKAPDFYLASTCTVTDEQFGVGAPTHGEKILLCNNDGAYSAGSKNELDIPEGVSEIPVSFDWKIVAEDLRAFGISGEYVNGGAAFRHRPGSIQIELRQIGGALNAWVFKKTLDEIEKDLLSQVGSEDWLGTTDWQHFSKTIVLPDNLSGKYRLQILVTQQGYDNHTGRASLEGTTHFFMDRLRFRETDS